MRCAWALLVLVGCTDEPAPPFHYIASERIDQVMTRTLVDRAFDSYTDALAEPPQTFVLDDGTTARTIELSIGACRGYPCLGGVMEETVVLAVSSPSADAVVSLFCEGTDGRIWVGIDVSGQGACRR